MHLFNSEGVAKTALQRAKEVLTHAPLDDGAKINTKYGATADGRFGPVRKYANGSPKNHHGVDLAANEGDSVYAAGDGKVYLVKEIKGYGKIVYITHADGVITRSAHLDSQSVVKGQKVSAGDVIGTVGRSGNLPAGAQTHLHYEVLVDWKRIDPASVHRCIGASVHRYMGTHSNMKKLLSLCVLFFSSMMCYSGGVNHKYTYEYSEVYFYLQYQGEVVWKRASDPSVVHLIETGERYLLMVFEYESSYDIGGVDARIFDKVEGVVVDILEAHLFLEVLQSSSEVIVSFGYNKYGFLDPGSTVWPMHYRVRGGHFLLDRDSLNDAEIQKLGNELSEFIGRAYLICEGEMENCFYSSEYEKAVFFLRDLYR